MDSRMVRAERRALPPSAAWIRSWIPKLLEEILLHPRLKPYMSRLCIALVSLLCCTTLFGQANEYNGIYKGNEGNIFSRKPNAFLVEVTRTRKPGKALDVGMGQGRNSIYLARHGWEVTGFDIADEGVRKARAEAARLGIKLSALVSTFDEFEFRENAWDLIVLMYVPTREIAPRAARALKPGGVIVVEDRHLETRRVWPEGGLFADNELPTLFPGLRVLRYEDQETRSDWQAERIQERLVRLVSEKPITPEPGCLWKGKVVAEGGDVCWDKIVKFRCTEGGWFFTHENCK